MEPGSASEPRAAAPRQVDPAVTGPLEPGEYAPFYAGYVARVGAADVLELLARQPRELCQLISGLAPEQETFRYAPGKWSVREVLGHVADGERVFGYRALCVSRGEQASLPGFDEGLYVQAAGYHARPAAELLDELLALRAANLRMFSRLDAAAWRRVGVANGAPISARALAYVTAGHLAHHLAVLRERYRLGAAAATPSSPGAIPLEPSTSAAAIRLATREDAGALAALRFACRAALGAAVEPRAKFEERCRRWMEARLGANAGWRCWVLEEGGRLVGQVWVQLIEKVPNPITERELHAYLNNLYVAPPERGSGRGSRLLAAALGWCAEQGVDAVLLWPSPESRSLYQRHGFAVRGDVLELRPPALTAGAAVAV